LTRKPKEKGEAPRKIIITLPEVLGLIKEPAGKGMKTGL
jgi:hypothetical protein